MSYSKAQQTQKRSRLREDTPVRFNKKEYQERQEWIMSKEVCQVCDTSTDLDAPHHADYGLGKKDDRSLVCICIACHKEVHSGSYLNLKKSREQILRIGYNNNDEYLKKESE